MSAHDEWAELEAKAKAVSPKKWEPFLASSCASVMAAGSRKEIVKWTGFDASDTATTNSKRRDLAAFIAAANPATILKLIEAARQSDGGETVVVPREPTEAMLAAWDAYRHNASGVVAWNAMLTAAPLQATSTGDGKS